MADPLRLLQELVPREACGVEIGAHVDPVPGVAPYYVERDADYDHRAGRQDVQADGVLLPIRSGELDFLCSSHVLEHVPDVIVALLEWWRVLRRGGLLYLIVPDRRFTFDRARQPTTRAHFLEDFRAGVTNADEEHIRDFIFGVDWNVMVPRVHPEGEAFHRRQHFELYAARARAGEPVDIHYHVFEPASLDGLLDGFGFTRGLRPLFRVLARAERFPGHRGDGIGLLLQKVGGRKVPRSRRAPTFVLRRPDNTAPALPLVCPATLEPLELAGTDSDGQLVARNGGTRYDIVHGVPQLMVASGTDVRRPWRHAAWRERVLRAGRWRRSWMLRWAL
jgi:SAM-dependent methyltransferase/uncharacterized protein YbaR (Trm112 family)